jgi:hypothetical protein
MPDGTKRHKELVSQVRLFILDIMSDSRPKSLSQFVSEESSALGRLASEAAARVALTDHLRAGLAGPLGDCITGSNLRADGTLVILTDGPEWAARLRFESDRLLALGRALHPAAARVRVRVSTGR